MGFGLLLAFDKQKWEDHTHPSTQQVIAAMFNYSPGGPTEAVRGHKQLEKSMGFSYRSPLSELFMPMLTLLSQ